MKTKPIIGLLLAVAISEVVLVNYRYKKHLEAWNKVACETFEEALWEDLENRGELKVKYYGKNSLISIGSKIPKSVFVITKDGKKEYKIDSCKHVNNVVSDPLMRQLYSIVLEKHPILSDTLNTIWKHRLNRKNIVASTGVCVSVTDLDNHTKLGFSKPFETKLLKDSLLSRYAGYRCEIEVTGFVNHAWFSNMNIKDYFFFSIPLLVAAILCIVGIVFKNKIKKCFTKEVPVIIEKEIPVIVKDENETHIYKLAGGILFNVKASLLKNGDKSIQLTPQAKNLLKMFIEAKDCRLANDEIISHLWLANDGTLAKVHKSVARLREQIIEIPEMKIINDDGAYRLIISHSIEE